LLDVVQPFKPFEPELIKIPAGEFLMGSDPEKDEKAGKDEQPQHSVYVSEFYISKYPVTNEQYLAFAKATSYDPPDHWKKGKIPPSKENHPVVHVSWEDANAYCKWLAEVTGKPYRLPTEAEWEKAARGTEGRLYPWGDEWDETKCNTSGSSVGGTTPVGGYSPQGDSPYGCADMAGNVWEMCADWYSEDEYKSRAEELVKDPQGPERGRLRVVRGGAFIDGHRYARCASRHGPPPPLYLPPRELRFSGGGVRPVLTLDSGNSDL
jgi:formylglycine-generating enzyme required for sulfatase activity